jgi:hypothetical protein
VLRFALCAAGSVILHGASRIQQTHEVDLPPVHFAGMCDARWPGTWGSMTGRVALQERFVLADGRKGCIVLQEDFSMESSGRMSFMNFNPAVDALNKEHQERMKQAEVDKAEQDDVSAQEMAQALGKRKEPEADVTRTALGVEEKNVHPKPGKSPKRVLDAALKQEQQRAVTKQSGNVKKIKKKKTHLSNGRANDPEGRGNVQHSSAGLEATVS